MDLIDYIDDQNDMPVQPEPTPSPQNVKKDSDEDKKTSPDVPKSNPDRKTIVVDPDDTIIEHNEATTFDDVVKNYENDPSKGSSNNPSNGARNVVVYTLLGTGATILAIFLILYESGLLGDWLRVSYEKHNVLNNKMIKKLITGGTLAHWKNKNGCVPLMGQRGLPTGHSLVSDFEYIAIYRSLVDSKTGELIQIGDYDLYETLLLIDKDTGDKYLCVACEPQDNSLYFDVFTEDLVYKGSRQMRRLAANELGSLAMAQQWIE